MQKNLVIVESPAKAKTIEKFLGSDYKVLSSYGHIRDLKKKEFSIDTDTFTPEYEIPEEKAKLVSELKSQAEKAETVWLASDEDREGEAISWHLYEVLNLKPEHTKRIVFHEITKPAILSAIEHPRQIDLNLVNAQQARRVLDRIVGFKLSPVLWKKVKPALSAGRVQSVAVRLIVEKEREIQQFKSEANYRVTALFEVPENKTEIKAELNQRFKTKEEAMAFLESCKQAAFRIDDIATRPQKRTPSAPFTTSTLQQEAAHKLGFTVAQTMMIAQKLYESGKITYMRTDSVNLSSLCINACIQVITDSMGSQYVKSRQFQTKSKGAQEAHEAIRPTYMDQTEIDGTPQEKRLYDLIWKRTIASQMADAELEKTTVSIQSDKSQYTFVATGEVIKFDGFLKVYRETRDEDADVAETESGLLPPLSIGETLNRKEVTATQRFSQHPPRYNEASLVKKLEELGIGRPSTYAPTISTIQQREYVTKGDKSGEEKEQTTLTLKQDQISETTKQTIIGAERNKLIPTDVGIVVNDFLLQFFPEIMDYNFTAEVEKRFDEVAEGKTEWTKLMQDFYQEFSPLVEKTLNVKSEHKVGERELGKDPKSGKPVFVKIGRFGPVVQIGSADDKEKPRFAQMKQGQSMETITLDEALDLFKLPRTLGEFEGTEVSVGAGRFGPYILHDKKYVSIPAGKDPLSITLDEAVTLIQEKRKAEEERHLKTFDEEPELEILNGRYGPYLAYKGKNYRLPKNLAEKARDLSLEECMEVIKEQDEKPAKTTKGKRTYTKKK
ncbi:MAG: type I DNA topoisomerase [Candidatus Paraprevotella stercoravium]|uniref:DNA topoisomerase 1 n=2 Tax=Bacteroidales TaxID=171549 RepID=A0ABT7U7P4_9BACE|nr:type I DNA topoisomerase [Candidatus Paraprevotella stercoravium]MDM8146561.1 type I DNA topoisomerase [Bacteroides eggerthii]